MTKNPELDGLRAETQRLKRETGMFVSVRTAADLLDVSPKTIRAMVADGRLSEYRVNGQPSGQLRIKRAELTSAMRASNISSHDARSTADRVLAKLTAGAD